MQTVKHRIGVKTTVENVFNHLSQPELISTWWSSVGRGIAEQGASVELGFEQLTTLVFTITALQPGKQIEFTCLQGPESWLDTKLKFMLNPDDSQIFLYLHHTNIHQNDEVGYYYFNTKWPVYLLSLKDQLEKNSGRPYPQDIEIFHGDH